MTTCKIGCISSTICVSREFSPPFIKTSRPIPTHFVKKNVHLTSPSLPLPPSLHPSLPPFLPPSLPAMLQVRFTDICCV